jgi:hypothetical protein
VHWLNQQATKSDFSRKPGGTEEKSPVAGGSTAIKLLPFCHQTADMLLFLRCSRRAALPTPNSGSGTARRAENC